MMTCPVLAFSLWTTRFLPCTQTQNFFFVDDSFQDNLLVSAFCHASSNNVAIPVMDNNFLAVFAGGLCLFFPLNNFLWSQTEESFFCQFAHSPILITALQFSLSARVLKRTLKKLVCVSVHLVPQKGHPSLLSVGSAKCWGNQCVHLERHLRSEMTITKQHHQISLIFSCTAELPFFCLFLCEFEHNTCIL